jgi:ADP-ribose pyrophosphatase YjhB (NUDIX family)
MEHGETTREAAAREVWEETGAVVTNLEFRGVYNVPGSVQLLYVSRVSGTAVEAQMASSTLESSEVALYSIDAIPYDELSFPTVKWALDHCMKCETESEAGVHVDSRRIIEQRTKFYNSELDKWSEWEDEAQ